MRVSCFRSLADDERGDAIVPGLSATEADAAEVGYVAADHGVASTEIGVSEDLNARSAKDLDGGDIVSKPTREVGQTVAGADTEVVSLEIPSGVDARPTTGVGAAVPGWVPSVVLRAESPGVACWNPVLLRRSGLCDGGNGEDQDEEC